MTDTEPTTDATPSGTRDYYTTINRLLERANHPGTTDAERDNATAMAQRLMQRYAISEAMLDSARAANEKRDEIGTDELIFTGVFGTAMRDIAATIVRANDGRPLVSERKATVEGKNGKDKRQHQFVLIVHAYGRDIERIKLLSANVQMQAMASMTSYLADRKTMVDPDHDTKRKLYDDRCTFLASFSYGLAEKLRAATREAVNEHVTETAATTSSTESSVRSSVEVALRSKRDSVDDWVDSYYGRGGLRTVRGGNRGSRGSFSASMAGGQAGRSADVGTPRVNGGPRQLGR